jgi:hypothetical protein
MSLKWVIGTFKFLRIEYSDRFLRWQNCYCKFYYNRGLNTELLGFQTLSLSGIEISRRKTRRFGNWICFRPQFRGDTYLDHWKEKDQVSETSCFSSNYFESGRWTKSENPVILCVIHHRQNPIESRGLNSSALGYSKNTLYKAIWKCRLMWSICPKCLWER